MRTEVKDFHFYASSIGRWRVKDDIGELIAIMKLDKLDFNLWKVPGDQTIHYDIHAYMPMVRDRVYLGQYRLINKKWVCYARETVTVKVA